MTFINFVYTKIYGECSFEFRRFNAKLQSLFEAYKSSPSLQPSSSNALCNDLNVRNDDTFDTMEAFKEFDKMLSNEF
ncbi:hypothetical protein Scep_007523 [Stephania cephalantha]|uniref:Uncharacterized protein n=1 Tax=Stephania cephalantha TaxID=152367 RepID=A0AAP0PQ49_9MAGN